MRTLALPATILSLAAIAVANLPPSSRNPTLDAEAIRAALAPPARVEDDGVGLVTITVALAPGEDLKAAYRRARAAGDAWKRQNPAIWIDFESEVPLRDRAGRVVGAYRHLSYCGVCCPPVQPPPANAAPPKKP